MFKKETALKIAVITLGIIAGVDIIRGLMHTFFIMFASENIAHMTQTPDTLNLMNVFGIANLLSGVTYILIVKKAKELAPYMLMLIPITYVVGMISSNITGVAAMQTSAWNGQYMMFVYLAIAALVGINYFISSAREKRIEAK